MADDDSLSAMRKFAARLDELEQRNGGTSDDSIALDDAVRAFSVRVQRLARELADLRGRLSRMTGRDNPPPRT